MSDTIEVTVGRFGRAVGIRGEIAVDLRTDEPGRRFFPGAKLLLGATGRKVEIAGVRWNRGRLAVTLVGYPDRTAVEALTGSCCTPGSPPRSVRASRRSTSTGSLSASRC